MTTIQVRTQGGKNLPYFIFVQRPEELPGQQGDRVPPACPCSPPRLLRFSNLCNSAGTDSTSFSFLHPALPTRIRVMLAWVIGSGEGPWLSGAPEHFSSSPLSYPPTLERCWAGHQKTWRPGKPHLGCIQEAILLRYLSHLIWLLPMSSSSDTRLRITYYSRSYLWSGLFMIWSYSHSKNLP